MRTRVITCNGTLQVRDQSSWKGAPVVMFVSCGSNHSCQVRKNTHLYDQSSILTMLYCRLLDLINHQNPVLKVWKHGRIKAIGKSKITTVQPPLICFLRNASVVLVKAEIEINWNSIKFYAHQFCPLRNGMHSSSSHGQLTNTSKALSLVDETTGIAFGTFP